MYTTIELKNEKNLLHLELTMTFFPLYLRITHERPTSLPAPMGIISKVSAEDVSVPLVTPPTELEVFELLGFLFPRGPVVLALSMIFQNRKSSRNFQRMHP
jgi:hypothetical protein